MLEYKSFVALAIFYASHLVWVYLVWALWRWRKKREWRMLAWRATLAGLFIWMRFVEPQWIIERETTTPLQTGTRVALLSDFHLGAFNNADFVTRVAEHLNAARPHCVLIAGDFLHAPQEPLDALFAGFKAIQVPVYAVLGNHDARELGWPRGGEAQHAEVKAALERNKVTVIEDKIVPCGKVMVAGIGDRWTGRENFAVAQAYQGAAPLVILTHNPDTAYDTPKGITRLVLAGHTHGGQIRLPFVYRYVIPVRGPFDRGLLTAPQWSDDPAGRPDVFTTSGVGEIGLPMRLLNPPAIDLLRL